MTTRQILNRIAELTTLAAQCVAKGAKTAAAEFYNLILRYQFKLMTA